LEEKAMKKLTYELLAIIRDEDGNVVATSKSSRAMPDFDEVDNTTFLEEFDKLETAVIDATNETNRGIVTDYISATSKKKRKSAVGRK